MKIDAINKRERDIKLPIRDAFQTDPIEFVLFYLQK